MAYQPQYGHLHMNSLFHIGTNVEDALLLRMRDADAKERRRRYFNLSACTDGSMQIIECKKRIGMGVSEERTVLWFAGCRRKNYILDGTRRSPLNMPINLRWGARLRTCKTFPQRVSCHFPGKLALYVRSRAPHFEFIRIM